MLTCGSEATRVETRSLIFFFVFWPKHFTPKLYWIKRYMYAVPLLSVAN